MKRLGRSSIHRRAEEPARRRPARRASCSLRLPKHVPQARLSLSRSATARMAMPRQQLQTTATMTPAAAQLEGTLPDRTLATACRTMITGPRTTPNEDGRNPGEDARAGGPEPYGLGRDRPIRAGGDARHDETDRAGIEEEEDIWHLRFHPCLIPGRSGRLLGERCKRHTAARPLIPTGKAMKSLGLQAFPKAASRWLPFRYKASPISVHGYRRRIIEIAACAGEG